MNDFLKLILGYLVLVLAIAGLFTLAASIFFAGYFDE